MSLTCSVCHRLTLLTLICHRLTLSATYLYSACHILTLSTTYLLCLVTDVLCHLQTYSACHRLILFVTDLHSNTLCLNLQRITVIHSLTRLFSHWYRENLTLKIKAWTVLHINPVNLVTPPPIFLLPLMCKNNAFYANWTCKKLSMHVSNFEAKYYINLCCRNL